MSRRVGGSLPSRLRSGARWLLDTVLPPGCPGCDEELVGRRWLCGGCRRSLRAVPPVELCIACRLERRASTGREAGLGCGAAHHEAWRGRAAWWMESPLDAVIHRFKYGGVPTLAEPLSRLLAYRVPAPPAWGITSIPLHATRRRERGYDQAELLARALAARWGIPHVPGLLLRRRATPAQARLPEGRRADNVKGAFQVDHAEWVQGRVWVLVDDVVTTGSTLDAAAEELREAGATGVVPVALALA